MKEEVHLSSGTQGPDPALWVFGLEARCLDGERTVHLRCGQGVLPTLLPPEARVSTVPASNEASATGERLSAQNAQGETSLGQGWGLICRLV